jgi:hypothetical protein
VGTVHEDGSITFAGSWYPTIRELPSECVAFRPDLEIQVKWRVLYRTTTPGSRGRPAIRRFPR